MPQQADLFLVDDPPGPAGPEGFRYAPDLLSPETEQEILDGVSGLPFKPFEFHGYLGNRRIVSFGLRYDYARGRVEESAELPPFLQALRTGAAGFAGRPPEDFVQALVTEYAPGAGIGWHRDKPEFGQVVGISLLQPCTFRFRRRIAERWERRSMTVAPRSAYLLSGPARSQWQHSIPPLPALRYSITFRTLAAGGGA